VDPALDRRYPEGVKNDAVSEIDRSAKFGDGLLEHAVVK
jgi:hypothetical protein